MGNHSSPAASIRDRVIQMAQEEEARLRKTHASKAQKRALVVTKVNQSKTVLFDFEANKDYPEQISVRRDEVVFCIENCGDGWSQVTNSRQKKGVVPTSYLGVVVEKPTFKQAIYQRVQVLKDLAVSQANEKAWALVSMAMTALSLLFLHVIMPTLDKLYRFFSRDESYTSLLAGGVRNLHYAIMVVLIPVLDDGELLEANAHLLDSARRIHEERARRGS